MYSSCAAFVLLNAVLNAASALPSGSVTVGVGSCASSGDCGPAINDAIGRLTAQGGGDVILDAGGLYPIQCSSASAQVKYPGKVGTSPAYALAIVGAAHIRLRGADQGGTPAALLMDYSPEPCGGILVSESRNITVADITLDVRRPPSTLVEYVGPNEDGQSFSLRAANVTGPDAEAYSFAGLASGRYPWLGAFGTMMPVERYGDDGRWRYIPNGQYLWCDDQKLTQEYDQTTGVLRVTQNQCGKQAMKYKPGQQYVLRHFVTPYQGMYMWHSKNVIAERVTLFSTAGMGFMAQHTSGLTALRTVAVRKRHDRPFSITADATHFMACAGQLEISDSLFEGHGDDGLNVHGDYAFVTEIRSEHNAIAFKPMWEKGIPLMTGDRFRFQGRRSLEMLLDTTLVRTESEAADREVAYFQDPLPDSLTVGDMFISLDRAPATTVRNSQWRECRCRGAVMSTGPAPLLIENCSFHHTTKSAVILINGGVQQHCYHEGPFSQDVQIRRNHFVVPEDGYKSGGLAWGVVQVTVGVPKLGSQGAPDDKLAEMYTGDEVPFGRVSIEDNVVQMGGTKWPRAAFHLGYTTHTKISGNDVTYPASTQREADFCVYNCSSVDVSSSNTCSGKPCTLAETTCEQVGGGLAIV